MVKFRELFDEVDENLFRPLTGINKRKYADILTLIWERCKRQPLYAIEKSTIFDMVEQESIKAVELMG